MKRNSVRENMARRGSILKPREHYRRGTIVLSHFENQIAKGGVSERDIATYNRLKAIKDKDILHSRTIVGLSIFSGGFEDTSDPFIVNKMPLDLQLAFR